mgnify:CR=1 FL=1
MNVLFIFRYGLHLFSHICCFHNYQGYLALNEIGVKVSLYSYFLINH